MARKTILGKNVVDKSEGTGKVFTSKQRELDHLALIGSYFKNY
jgi:hypothetical protein